MDGSISGKMTLNYLKTGQSYTARSLLALNLLLAAPHGEATHPESWFIDRTAAKYNGTPEVRMPDGTRCDVVTVRHAIEVEFASKWKEAIGQSLHYSLQSGRIPGILLILTDPKDEHYLSSLRELIDHYDLIIDVFAIRTWEDSKLGDSERP